MNSNDLVKARIEELCKERKIRPNKLSTMAGIPPTTLDSLLCGRCQNMGIVTIEKLCGGLGISITEFFNSKEFADLSNK